MISLYFLPILILMTLIALRLFLKLSLTELMSYLFSISLFSVFLIAEIHFLDTNPYGYLVFMSFYPFFFFILIYDKRTGPFVKRILASPLIICCFLFAIIFFIIWYEFFISKLILIIKLILLMKKLGMW